MAYKFQLGAATMSGSLTQEGALDATSFDANGGGISQAGAIAGVSTISGSGKFEMGSLAIGGTDVSATAAEINVLAGSGLAAADMSTLAGLALDGVTGLVTADFTKLAAIDASAAELNHLNGIADAAYDAAADSVVFFDATDSKLKYEAANDFASALAGDALAASSGVLAVQVNSAGGIEVSSDALQVKLNSTPGLQKDSFGLGVKVEANKGLSVGLNGLTTVIEANKGLTVGSSGFAAVVDSDALQLGATGIDLKDTIAGAREFTGNITISGDLIVTGTTFSASVGTLVIEDALINIGDGQGTYADNYGIEFGTSGSAWAELKTAQVNSANHLSSSLPLAAPSFYGDGSNLTNVLATSFVQSSNMFSTNTTANFSNYTVYMGDTTSGALQLTLAAASGLQGGTLKIKNLGVNNLTIVADGTDTIESLSQIVLESQGAAVQLFSDGSDWYIF